MRVVHQHRPQENGQVVTMKKRKVSAFYTGLFGFTSIFFLVGIAFVMWFLVVYMQEDIASLRGLSLIGVILFLLQV